MSYLQRKHLPNRLHHGIYVEDENFQSFSKRRSFSKFGFLNLNFHEESFETSKNSQNLTNFESARSHQDELFPAESTPGEPPSAHTVPQMDSTSMTPEHQGQLQRVSRLRIFKIYFILNKFKVKPKRNHDTVLFHTLSKISMLFHPLSRIFSCHTHPPSFLHSRKQFGEILGVINYQLVIGST